mmetsp:Transcript_65714/g.165618  ORF Transcript_65714/g.165618 Transcript_65714/m.165618 type:complete len:147 (-) Transcript_65714:113-553(-)
MSPLPLALHPRTAHAVNREARVLVVVEAEEVSRGHGRPMRGLAPRAVLSAIVGLCFPAMVVDCGLSCCGAVAAVSQATGLEEAGSDPKAPGAASDPQALLVLGRLVEELLAVHMDGSREAGAHPPSAPAARHVVAAQQPKDQAVAV